ncbi:MAG: MarR family transcriptional regulator [Rhodospirillum sp.]|jgi:MarR family transcriptional regulator, transcriptional regulator for hemolysin|nr:MarR family transcriptional regulator [Rhodospirillum sp.]
MKTGRDTIGFLLNDAARLMRKDFERRTRSLGLTRAQWQALFHLARNEGCNQATLADLLEVEPITLARLVDRLEASGLVERRPDPGDRRARLLFLGERAHPLLEQLRALGAETREIALAGIDEDERNLLMTLLTKMRANLSGREAATAAA